MLYILSTKSNLKFFFLQRSHRLFTDFHQIWQTAAAINVQWCLLSTSSGVYRSTHITL